MPAADLVELWQSGVGLAKHLARRRARQLQDLLGDRSADFEQAALLGLWKASLAYQPRRGVKFTSFAWHYIRGELNCERWQCDLFGFKAGKAVAYKQAILPERVPLADIDDTKIPCCADTTALFDNQELLLWMIKQLRPVKAQVVARRYWLEGLSTATIAHQMALSVDRIEQLRAQANKDLHALAHTLTDLWQYTGKGIHAS